MNAGYTPIEAMSFAPSARLAQRSVPGAAEKTFWTRMNADLRIEENEKSFALSARIRVDPRQKISFTMKYQGR
jgi:hypothetical protein